jgi:hypothetical protein
VATAQRVFRSARIGCAWAVAFLCSASCRQTGAGSFGPLPAGPVDRWELGGIRADVALQHLITPSLLTGRVPPGLRPRTLVDAARADPFAASFLADHPEYADHALGVLDFLSLDTLLIAGRRIGGGAPALAAFWWLQLMPSDSMDWRARGPTSMTLGFWLTDTTGAGVARRVWPPIEVARLAVQPADTTGWTLRLALPDAEIRGACRLEGPTIVARYPLPAYTTLWAGDRAGTVFSIWTFYGHRARRCEGAWEATGDHPLAIALRTTPPDYPTPSMRAVFEDGWHARAGVYRRP